MRDYTECLLLSVSSVHCPCWSLTGRAKSVPLRVRTLTASHTTLPLAVVPRGDALLQRSANYRRGLQDGPSQGQGAGEQAAEERVGACDLPQGRMLALGGGKLKILLCWARCIAHWGHRECQQSGTASTWKQKAGYSLEGSVRRTNRICAAQTGAPEIHAVWSWALFCNTRVSCPLRVPSKSATFHCRPQDSWHGQKGCKETKCEFHPAPPTHSSSCFSLTGP